MSDCSLRDRISAKTKTPRVGDLEEICNTGGFDLLLQRNVQHVWEKIFLSLDYASFKNCLEVSEWTSQSHDPSHESELANRPGLGETARFYWVGCKLGTVP